jgi:hypothetical protein
MTYRELQSVLNYQLTDRQLDQDVSVAIIDTNGVEVFEACDFVDPNDDYLKENEAVRDSCYLSEIDGCILDEGHPYITVITQ